MSTTQYGELKNGLRAFVTYGTIIRYGSDSYEVIVYNGGIMAPAPVASDIRLADGTYSLTITDPHSGPESIERYGDAHTFAKGSSDRWLQIFLNTGFEVGGTLDHSTHTLTILMRRNTSPVYQTQATITIPQKSHWNISYNANGGTGAPGGQTKWNHEDLTLQSGRPTRTGYTFKNWNTKQNGTGTSYNPSQKYTANAGLTLYAQWTPISVTLSYNANGGSGAPASQTKVYDTALKLRTDTPTRTGYTFKGWATTQARANAGTVDYSAGGTYSANSTSNITLWAAWSPNPYAVTYNANGGSGAPASQTKYHGTNLTLQSGVPVKAGWLFRGWATSEANATARKNSGTAE